MSSFSVIFTLIFLRITLQYNKLKRNIFSWMYVQHKKDAKQLDSQKDAESGSADSVLQDVILSTAPKEAQIGSPVLNGLSNRKTGVNNPAFEMEK
jgi:hypothetical protein